MNHFLFNSSNRSRIIDWICSRIQQSEFLTEPFPHVIVKQFLPADFYDDLQRHFPSLDHFEAFGYEKHHGDDGNSNRKRFQTSNRSLSELPLDQKVFWHTVRSALGSREVKEAIFNKLSPGLAYRFGCKESEVNRHQAYALPEVFYEQDGYTIKPHPDTRKKMVTMQIALPSDYSQSEFGTEFYRRSINPNTWLREPRGFDIAKRMPFEPNTAYAFVVLNTIKLKSWHGKTAIRGDQGPRKSILNIWYDEVANASKDIEAENQRIYGDVVKLAS